MTTTVFDLLCRLCLQEFDSPESLFAFTMKCLGSQNTPFDSVSATLDEDGPSIEEMLTEFVKLSKDFPLPEQICLNCLNELCRFVVFKQRCEQSDQILREMVTDANNSEIKVIVKPEVTLPGANESQEQKETTLILKREDPICIEEVLQEDDDDDLVEEDHVYVAEADEEEKPEIIMEEYFAEPREEPEAETVPKKTVACPECAIPFVHKKSLQRHMQKFHSKNVEKSLEIVLSEEVEPQEYEQPNDAKFQCSKCGSYFAHKKSLNNHIRFNRCHLKSFKCEICSRVFVRKNALLLHMISHDLSKMSVLKCVSCSMEFATQEELSKHLNDHRESHKKHTCTECGKSFNMFSTLKDHLRTHSGEKPFLCSICGKGFSQSTNMKQHMMRHSKTKPFKCEVCNASFVSKGELDAHLRKHSGEHPFVCDSCGCGFTTSSSLVKHKRIHTGEKPYACEYCPMRFTALGTLKNHRRTHTGERPFACRFCDRSFTQKSDMVSHTRTHTGERPYVCNTCGAAFLQSSALKTHQKTHKTQQQQQITILAVTE